MEATVPEMELRGPGNRRRVESPESCLACSRERHRGRVCGTPGPTPKSSYPRKEASTHRCNRRPRAVEVPAMVLVEAVVEAVMMRVLVAPLAVAL